MKTHKSPLPFTGEGGPQVRERAVSQARRPLRRLRIGAAFAALALLGACSSGPPPRLILLSNDVAVPAASGNAQRPLLVVRTVAVPEYLDRRAVVYRSADAELKPFADAVWAERLGQSLTRWIALQLAADLPDHEVQAFAAAGEQMPGLVLNIELQSFEPQALPATATVLHLRGAWHLSGGPGADGRLAVDVPVSALDAPSTVAAMRTALTQASADIAEQVRRLPAPAK